MVRLVFSDHFLGLYHLSNGLLSAKGPDEEEMSPQAAFPRTFYPIFKSLMVYY